MRRAFLTRVSDMIRNEPDTTFFTVDIGMWAIRDVLKEFPDRCTNVGIYEDGMFSIAAGMSRRGLVPTIFGIQPYLIERTLEQIKMDFAYQKCGVNIVGTGAAVDYPKYGYSHYCAEDVQLIKMIPGCEFVAPGNAKEFISLFNQSYRNGHPTFFRISDHPNVKYDVDVKFGKANVIQKGKRATIIAVGVMLDMVMDVFKGKDVTVLYYTTLEPFDKETLKENCSSNEILVVEPEYKGSLDHDIISALPNKYLRIQHVGFPREIFRNYGTYEEKLNYYNLTRSKLMQSYPSLMCEWVKEKDEKQDLHSFIVMKMQNQMTDGFILKQKGIVRKKCIVVQKTPNWLLRFYLRHENACLIKILKKVYVKTHDNDYYDNCSFILKNKYKKFPLSISSRFDDNQLLVSIVTKNRPVVIKKNLFRTMPMYFSYNVSVLILDSSTDDKTERIVRKMMKKYPNHLFYKRHVDTDEKSIDTKCLQMYKDNIARYEYIWLLRDRLCPLMFMSFDLLKDCFDKKDDVVVLFNNNDNEQVVATSYNVAFLQFTFNRLLTLGLGIYKSSFMEKLLNTIPLDEKNYTFYLPTALYQYAENNEFTAKICYGRYIAALYETFKPSFWIKDLSWQFFDRFYTILMGLAEYEPYRESVSLLVQEHHHLLPTVQQYNLLQARMRGGFTPEDVRKYEKQIKFFSPYDYSENIKIANLSSEEAAKRFKKILGDIKKGLYREDHIKINELLGEF